MIIFWNRNEVYTGFSMKRFGEVRNILSANGIKYTYKVVNRNSNRSRTGTLGEKSQMAYEYYIYVHKNDYANAYSIISKH